MSNESNLLNVKEISSIRFEVIYGNKKSESHSISFQEEDLAIKFFKEVKASYKYAKIYKEEITQVVKKTKLNK